MYYTSHKSIHLINGLFKANKTYIKLLEAKAQYFESL